MSYSWAHTDAGHREKGERCGGKGEVENCNRNMS